jgi:hypothetical protein
MTRNSASKWDQSASNKLLETNSILFTWLNGQTNGTDMYNGNFWLPMAPILYFLRSEVNVFKM